MQTLYAGRMLLFRRPNRLLCSRLLRRSITSVGAVTAEVSSGETVHHVTKTGRSSNPLSKSMERSKLDSSALQKLSHQAFETPHQTMSRYASRYTEEHPLWLRDNCRCSRCVDPSTSQRQFQTADIPTNIVARVVKQTDKILNVAWQNDMPGYGDDHVSTYSYEFLDKYSENATPIAFDGFQESSNPNFDGHEEAWTAEQMRQKIQFVEYQDYIKDDEAFFQVLLQLRKYGLVFIKNAPTDEITVEKIVERIGHLRHTFYGRTWNVKSVPQAKNVAYTSQFLGFHMDLLYMADPPGFQFLHSLKSTCKGGESMFMDSYLVEKELSLAAEHGSDQGNERQHLRALEQFQQVFHYDNDGEYYRYTRPVIERTPLGDVKCINWSPPFQGPTGGVIRPNEGHISFSDYAAAAKKFASIVEDPKNIYEYRMEEGDCVIFNNRRVLHARREFDTTSGERWLKGAYLSTDEFNSRYRVKFREALARSQEAKI